MNYLQCKKKILALTKFYDLFVNTCECKCCHFLYIWLKNHIGTNSKNGQFGQISDLITHKLLLENWIDNNLTVSSSCWKQLWLVKLIFKCFKTAVHA